jgi:hypothetical protein
LITHNFFELSTRRVLFLFFWRLALKKVPMSCIPLSGNKETNAYFKAISKSFKTQRTAEAYMALGKLVTSTKKKKVHKA